MKNKIIVALAVASLLGLIVTSANSQSQDNVFSRFKGNYVAKPAIDNAAVTANFATSVNRFFPAATTTVTSVFREAIEKPELFNREFIFKAETPFTVTIESSIGRANVQTTFKDYQDALFTVVPKDQQLFVASTLMGIATGFKDACVFKRFGPDGRLAFIAIESTAFAPNEVRATPGGTVSDSFASAEMAARFAKALNGKAVNANYGIMGEDIE